MSKKILIADDEPHTLRVAELSLKKGAFQILLARNGREAVDLAIREKPDLVVLDVVMPEISGFDACRKIKELLQPKALPVIVMTGKLDAIDPMKARKAGADDFVVKTSYMAVLAQAVRKILS